jgi:hypothetical protein
MDRQGGDMLIRRVSMGENTHRRGPTSPPVPLPSPLSLHMPHLCL